MTPLKLLSTELDESVNWLERYVYWIFNKRFLYPIFVPVFIFSLGTNSNLFPVIPLMSDLIYSDSITEVLIK